MGSFWHTFGQNGYHNLVGWQPSEKRLLINDEIYLIVYFWGINCSHLKDPLQSKTLFKNLTPRPEMWEWDHPEFKWLYTVSMCAYAFLFIHICSSSFLHLSSAHHHLSINNNLLLGLPGRSVLVLYQRPGGLMLLRSDVPGICSDLLEPFLQLGRPQPRLH